MSDQRIDDDLLTRILQETRTIAMIGASPRPDRHSHRVMRYMQQNGYQVFPVNPTVDEDTILGAPVYAGLADVPAPIDTVNVFRRSDAVPGVVDEVLGLREEKAIRFLWMQLGVVHDAAAARARDAGLEVVMDRCLKIEFGRLLSHP